MAALAATALAVAGCSSTTTSDMFSKEAGDNWFAKPMDVFAKPDWAKTSAIKDASFRPATADDFIDSSGRCGSAPEPVQNVATTGSTDPDQPQPFPTPLPAGPTVAGGVALSMTECEVVARAGQPENVEIGASDGGERRVVLTYIRGTWPGIYKFTSGRLNEIERAPAPPEPPKPPPKKKPAAKPKPKTAPVAIQVTPRQQAAPQQQQPQWPQPR